MADNGEEVATPQQSTVRKRALARLNSAAVRVEEIVDPGSVNPGRRRSLIWKRLAYTVVAGIVACIAYFFLEDSLKDFKENQEAVIVAHFEPPEKGDNGLFVLNRQPTENEVDAVYQAKFQSTGAAPYLISIGARAAQDPFGEVVRVTLHSKRSRPVIITNIRVKKKCEESTGKTLFITPQGGSGKAEPLILNLDEPDPVLRQRIGESAAGKPFFDENHITVGGGIDPGDLSITVHSSKTCTWSLSAEYQNADESGVIELLDNGKPLTYTRIPRKPDECFVDGYPSNCSDLYSKLK